LCLSSFQTFNYTYFISLQIDDYRTLYVFGNVTEGTYEGAAEGIAEYTYTQYIGIKDPYAS